MRRQLNLLSLFELAALFRPSLPAAEHALDHPSAATSAPPTAPPTQGANDIRAMLLDYVDSDRLGVGLVVGIVADKGSEIFRYGTISLSLFSALARRRSTAAVARIFILSLPSRSGMPKQPAQSIQAAPFRIRSKRSSAPEMSFDETIRFVTARMESGPTARTRTPA